MNESVKAGIKFSLNKINLNDWSSVNPKITPMDTLITMFEIADKMGRLSEEQKEQLNAIKEQRKSTRDEAKKDTCISRR